MSAHHAQNRRVGNLVPAHRKASTLIPS